VSPTLKLTGTENISITLAPYDLEADRDHDAVTYDTVTQLAGGNQPGSRSQLAEKFAGVFAMPRVGGFPFEQRDVGNPAGICLRIVFDLRHAVSLPLLLPKQGGGNEGQRKTCRVCDDADAIEKFIEVIRFIGFMRFVAGYDRQGRVAISFRILLP
jgi:hypothetical protein